MSDTPKTDERVAWIKGQLSADACDTDHPYYVLDQMAGLCRRLEREVAQARALAIAEAARIAAKHIREPDGSEFCAGESLGAKQIEKEIRALSPAPSVTEEWFRERVIECRALSVDASVCAVIAEQLEAELAALKIERDEAKSLVERLKLEAQAHAQEARTANATIAEIYQVCSGSTGEPGNWHGAEPVRAAIAAIKAAQPQEYPSSADDEATRWRHGEKL